MTQKFLPMDTAPRQAQEVIQLQIAEDRVVAAFYDAVREEWTFLDPREPGGVSDWPDRPLYALGWLPLTLPAF